MVKIAKQILFTSAFLVLSSTSQVAQAPTTSLQSCMVSPDFAFFTGSSTAPGSPTPAIGVLSRSAFRPNKLWPTGSTLQVSFLSECDINFRDDVKSVAPTWSNYANIKFSFVGDNVFDGSQIVIGCERDGVGGAWSMLGTDSLSPISIGKKSMNYGSTLYKPNATRYGDILHEFGHALGLIHEHQSPNSPLSVDCNDPKIIEFLKNAHVDCDNLQKTVAQSSSSNPIVATAFDSDSIMKYQFPAEVAGPSAPSFSSGNTQLSQQDKNTISRMYPPTPASDSSCSGDFPVVVTLNNGGKTGCAATISPATDKRLAFSFNGTVFCVYAASTTSAQNNVHPHTLFAGPCNTVRSYDEWSRYATAAHTSPPIMVSYAPNINERRLGFNSAYKDQGSPMIIDVGQDGSEEALIFDTQFFQIYGQQSGTSFCIYFEPSDSGLYIAPSNPSDHIGHACVSDFTFF